MTHDTIGTMLVDEGLLTQDEHRWVQDQLKASSPEASYLTLAAKLTEHDESTLLDQLVELLVDEAEHVRLSQAPHDPNALSYLTAQDAWDYVILPLAIEPDGHLLCATTEENLSAALAFLLNTLAIPFRVVLAEVRPLEQYIAEQYHYEGVDVDAA